jgi:hypothetical protein
LLTNLVIRFDYFVSTGINITVNASYIPQAWRRLTLTVPYDFLDGPRFSWIHLYNIELMFSETPLEPIKLSQITHLDMHNVTIDPTSVLDNLEENGCNDTDVIRADPYSYVQIQKHCLPASVVIQEGHYNRLYFGQNELAFGGQGDDMTITLQNNRPRFVEILLPKSPGRLHNSVRS